MLPPRREKDEKICRLLGKTVDQASDISSLGYYPMKELRMS